MFIGELDRASQMRFTRNCDTLSNAPAEKGLIAQRFTSVIYIAPQHSMMYGWVYLNDIPLSQEGIKEFPI